MRNRKNTRKEAVFFRFYNDLYCYCQSIQPHPRLREAPSDRRRTDSTGISPIRCPTSLPATFSRSDCDWTGVSLSSLWVMAKSGAARYFESIRLAHHLSIARCLSAGLGVPLHTLMLITITKRKYLANGYSLVKERPPFSPHKGKQGGGFRPLTLSPMGNYEFPLIIKIFF